MSSRLPDVLSPRDLPLTELSSLRLDGELFRLGDFWTPIDLAEDAQQRAKAAALLVPARAIAERLTAAWIYGLAPEPSQHQFCVHIAARAHVSWSPRFRFREVVCAAEETVRIGARHEAPGTDAAGRRDNQCGGLLVTRPLRTVLDLARWPSPELAEPAPLLAALLRFAGYPDTAAARMACAAGGLPYTNRALAQLRAAEIEMQKPDGRR